MTKAAGESVPPPGHEIVDHMVSRDGDENYIVALARGLAVMRAFAYQRDKLTLSEISKLVELPRATARRCLGTLSALGYVASDGKYFSLTPKVLTLAHAYFSSSSLPHVARPYIERVSDRLEESCSISVLAGDEVIYLVRSSRKRAASLHREVGVNLPAYCTSMGRVLLASLSDEELDGYFARVRLRKFNARTIVDEAELRQIIAQVKVDDYAIIDGELEPNLRAVAVPVRNRSGTVVAAAHVSTEANRVSSDKLVDAYLPVLVEAVAEISRALVG